MSARRAIALGALVITAGNVASRLLGLVREQVMAWLFGATGATDAFVAASAVPMMVYDFLVGGAISAALVPVFVEAAEEDERLWRLVSAVLNLAGLLLLSAAILLALLADPLMHLLGAGFEPRQHAEAVVMVRVMLGAVVLQGLAGVLMAALYARNRFAWPAFAPAAYNGGIIILALLLHTVLGVQALVAGVLLGAACQLALQWGGLRALRWRPVLDLGLPEVRTILRLYAPVAAGLVVSFVGIAADRAFASQLEAGSMSVMNYATRLIQFPIGLVVTALSLAVLPTLAKHAAADLARTRSDAPPPPGVGDPDRRAYIDALVFGLKSGWLLMVPAALGLSILSEPLVQLLFEHRAFTNYDTVRTATVFLFYAPQLPFVALDQVLIYAFYARRDTLTPVSIGVLAVVFYFGVALATKDVLGVNGLALANTVQNSAHGLILLGLIWLALGRSTPGGLDLVALFAFGARIVLASALMGLAIWLSLLALRPMFGSSVAGLAVLMLFEVGLGATVYSLAVLGLRVPEARQLGGIVTARLRRGRITAEP